jgi:hypothetical protein
LRWRWVERSSEGLSNRSRKELVMMFAFALAIVAVVVFGTLDLIAAHSH